MTTFERIAQRSTEIESNNRSRQAIAEVSVPTAVAIHYVSGEDQDTPCIPGVPSVERANLIA